MPVEYEATATLDDAGASELIDLLCDAEQFTLVKREPRRVTLVFGPLTAANARDHIVVKVRDDGSIYLSFAADAPEGEKTTQFTILTFLQQLGQRTNRFHPII